MSGTRPAVADEPRVLVLGRITQEPGRNIERLNAMAAYLDKHLFTDSEVRIQIAIAETPGQMAELLRSGKVDLFSETPFAALTLVNQGLAEPLLREWKKGVAEYHTVIVARTDSGITSLADLRGRKFAFEDQGSTSGYFLPRHALEAEGLELRELADPRGSVLPGEVGYSFAKGEINVVAWVNRGLADAGAISNIDWENPEKAPERLRQGLAVIHRTPDVIRSLMLVRSSLDQETRDRLTLVLAQMHETEEGRAALKDYFKVSRYDALTGTALTSLENARHIHAGLEAAAK